MKILFVASEALPYSKTGGLADVVEALPKALSEMGHEVAVFLPRYRGNKITSKIISSLTIPLGDTLRFPASSGRGAGGGGALLLSSTIRNISIAELLTEPSTATTGTTQSVSRNFRALPSNSRNGCGCRTWCIATIGSRRSCLCYCVRSTRPIPPCARFPSCLRSTTSVYQGLFPSSVMRRIGLPDQLFSIGRPGILRAREFSEGRIEFAEYLTTVSRRYAKEIQTPEYGANLDGVIRTRADRLVGILNGADYSIWSPEADTVIAQNYSIHNLEGKKACKKNLLETAGLPAENMDRPVIGIVSRFVDQKGFDLIAQVANDLMKDNLAIVALGSGQPEYEGFFRALAESFRAKAAVKIGYDDALAHKIIAGADMLLIPSRYEPCGLTQLYGLRYGTVPVVRATGGLDDTVQYYDPKTGHGTGFKFDEYEGRALLQCVRGALKAYKDPKIWRTIQANGMAKDFSWKASAAAYVTLYEAAKRSRIPRGISTSNRH